MKSVYSDGNIISPFDHSIWLYGLLQFLSSFFNSFYPVLLYIHFEAPLVTCDWSSQSGDDSPPAASGNLFVEVPQPASRRRPVMT